MISRSRIPIARAASYWPRSIETMSARNTSAKNAEVWEEQLHQWRGRAKEFDHEARGPGQPPARRQPRQGKAQPDRQAAVIASVPRIPAQSRPEFWRTGVKSHWYMAVLLRPVDQRSSRMIGGTLAGSRPKSARNSSYHFWVWPEA